MAKTRSRNHVKGLGGTISGLVRERIAAEAGKAGMIGAAAGAVASRLVKRSPVAALAVGSAWLMHKLYLKKKAQAEQEEEARALAAKPVMPAPPLETEAPQ